LRDSPAGILTVEGANHDELRMGDGGSSSKGGSKYVWITSTHPITEGFTGKVRVTTFSSGLGHMTDKNSWLGTDIELLAYYDNAGEIKAKLLAAEKGAKLTDGSFAEGKRVFYGAQHFANLNDAGKTIFNQAFEWVLWSNEDYSFTHTPPVITLIGSSEVSINQDATYTDLGATAVDYFGTDISEFIIPDYGSLNTELPGTYVVTYSVMDSEGYVSEATRNVEVIATSSTTSEMLNIALICKRSSCNHDEKDKPLKEHLLDLGHEVSTFNHKKQFNTAEYDLIVVSESVKSEHTKWLKTVTKPILTVEGANFDELELAVGGSSSGGKSKYIVVNAPESHQITAGLGIVPGVPVQVTTKVNHLGHMTNYAAGVQEIAHYESTGGSVKGKILVINTGDVLVEGTAPAKRAFYGAQYFDNLNELGVTLFDRTLEWVVS